MSGLAEKNRKAGINKETGKSKTKIAFLTFLFLLFIVISAPVIVRAAPESSQSGFISFIKAVFGFKDQPEKKSINTAQPINNSQNLAVLKAALNSDPLIGQGGGEINIIEENTLMPILGPEAALVENTNQDQSGQISIYAVKQGDTLTSIAKLFNVSVNTIFWSNNLTKKDRIIPGQTLVILPITGVKYEAQNGDTVEKIAEKFKGDIEEIIAFNNLSSNEKLEVGQMIIIPDGQLPYAQEITPSKIVPRGGPEYIGYYLRPISGGRKSQGLHGFNGVDLANYCGDPVFASAGGDVIVAQNYGWNGGYGKYLAINHPNGTQTLYSHLSSIIVSPGWHVVQGQVIGYIGSTGKSTGCHVHFEVRGAKNPF